MFFGSVRNQFAIRYNFYCTELEPNFDLFDGDLILVRTLIDSSISFFGLQVVRIIDRDLDLISDSMIVSRTVRDVSRGLRGVPLTSTICILCTQMRCLLFHSEYYQGRTSSFLRCH